MENKIEKLIELLREVFDEYEQRITDLEREVNNLEQEVNYPKK